jgi:hypothetical protein
MEHPEIDQQLAALRAALEQSEGLASGSRERLLGLIEQLEAQVHSEDDDGGLVSQLEAHVAEFEVSHPALSGTLNELMVILGNMGV